MFEFLSRNRSWPIALDLGSDAIKMLQMKRVGSVVRVAACGRWRYPQGAVDPRQRRDLAVAAVRDMLRSGAFTGRSVVSALSCEALGVKNVRLPHAGEAEMDRAVREEAAERFGFDIAPDRLCYLNAGQVRQGAETRDEVIMLAVSKPTIEEHLSMLSSMGLKPEFIDAEPVALFHTFERFLRRRADEQAVSVVIDIGSRGTRVVVARGREIVFIKNVEIGGRKFTEAVAKQLSIPYAEAQDLRSRVIHTRPEPAPAAAVEGAPAAPPVVGGRGTVDWTVYDAVRSEVESLGREVALCLRYCAVTFRGLRPDRVILTGGEAYDRAVVELLGEHLGVPCQVGQPLRGVDVSGVDLGGDRRATLSEWAICVGLAGWKNEIPVGNATREGEDERRLSA